jgi:inosose dehydratase
VTVEIGSCPESWGVLVANGPGQTPWSRFLDEVAEAGYSWIELGPYGYLPTDPALLGRELDRRGLKISAGFEVAPLDEADSWPEVEDKIVRSGELVAALGGRYLNLIDDVHAGRSDPSGDPGRRLEEDAWKRLIESTHKAARLARERFGLQLAVHPCSDTHVQYENEIKALLEQTDPNLVSLCLDTGHHTYAGGNPVSFMREHYDRICYVHLKSVNGDLLRRVKSENITLAEAVDMGTFCEPVDGVVDFKGFADVLKQVGYDGIATVEHDMHRPPLDVPLPIARRSLAYYMDAGIG